MSHHDQAYPYHYDMDRHIRLAERLDVMDRAEHMLRRNLIDRDMAMQFVLKGPFLDPGNFVDMTQIDGSRLASYMPERMRLMAPMMQAHVNLIHNRAKIVTRTCEAFMSLFPEEQQRYPLFRMLESTEAQVASLEGSVHVFRSIADPGTHPNLDLLGVDFKHLKHDLQRMRDKFRDTVGYPDIMAIPERANTILAVYHRLSEMWLEHAAIQADLAEHCLAVTATSKVLTRVFNAAITVPADGFRDIAAHMIVAAGIDLEHIESFRSAIYITSQSSRPVFPVGPFLTKP